MNYSEKEAERAKQLYAEWIADGRPSAFVYAVAGGMSAPGRAQTLVHRRTWRDFLVQARRELREDKRAEKS